MTKAYEDYHNIFMAETTALIELFGGLLQGSRSADEINQQADQHLANLKDAASQYWEKQHDKKFEKEKVHVDVALPDLMLQEIRKLRSWWVDLIGIKDEDLAAPLPDDQLLLMALDEWTTFKWEELALQDEIKMAHENGGRTKYLYTESGEEYYTTTDGIRHYTRVEG